MTERGKRHTVEEWLAQPSERRLELINGELVEKAGPTDELRVGQLLGGDPE